MKSEKAREWHDRGLNAKAPIDALTDYWRGFNNLFYSSAGQTEQNKIAAFLADTIAPDDAKNVLERSPAEIEYLLSQPVVDMRGNGRDTSGCIEGFHRAAEPVAKLVSLFLVIYQVRCNLEHGQKSPSRERDVELCRCAARVVADVVNMVA